MRTHPLITLVIMSITYYNMVGMDMEFCYHANFTKWFHLKEQWNCQNGQNGKWSIELNYPTLMKSFHWKNGMVKMDKMENGPRN